MKRVLLPLALLAASALAAVNSQVAGYPPASNSSDPAKSDKDAPLAKEEPKYNSPPKGAVLVALGQLNGRIAKGSDGQTFSVELETGGKKKEIEINLASYTKVRVRKQSEFDDKGNAKKTAPVTTDGTADAIRGGRTAVVTISGTRDGKWLVAKSVTITGE
jgi:hypothetical protein